MQQKLKMSMALFVIAVLLLAVAGCGSTAKAGTYSGTATGYHGHIELTTEIDQDGKIVDITIDKHNETDEYGSVSMEKIPQRIIDAQALDIDVISGATLTSNGIIGAVADALKTSGADPAKYGYVPAPEKDVYVTSLNKDAMPVKQETTGSVTITDAKGRDVTINLPISSYAISTMDVIDFIIPLKGAQAFDMLVGSGQDGGGGIQKYGKLYVPEVGNFLEHLGQISDHNAPFDLEMILAVQPDVLIVNSAMSAHNYALEVEDQLAAAGIPIVLINVPGKDLENSVQKTMHILGQIFQEQDKAAEVSDFVEQQYQLIASKNLDQRQDKPTVYYEKSGYSEIYGSTGTSVSGWGMPVSIAGGENIADALLLDTAAKGGSGNTLDPEYVLKADPDYIILSGINDGWLDSVKEKKKPQFDLLGRVGWSNLAAVKNGHFYEFAHATNRSIFAFYPCLKMAKIFYPEEFTDVNPEALLDEFFDRFMILDSDITTWFISLEDSK